MSPDQRRLRDEDIVDYLNGHLSAADMQRFEARLRSDPEFRERVEFERKLLSRIRTSDGRERRAPSFSKLQSRLKIGNRLRFSSPIALGAATATAIAVIALVAPRGPLSPIVEPQYDTLSDTANHYATPTLRIMLSGALSDEEIRLLLTDYDLATINRYPPTAVVDVRPRRAQDISQLQTELESDERVNDVTLLADDQ